MGNHWERSGKESLVSFTHSGKTTINALVGGLWLTGDGSNAGGGGERVLWAAVKATQKRWPKVRFSTFMKDITNSAR
jgi:hypothetical protein